MLRMLLPWLSLRLLLHPELRPSSPPVTTTAAVIGRGRGGWGFYATPPVLQNPQDIAREGGVAAHHGEQGWRQPVGLQPTAQLDMAAKITV